MVGRTAGLRSADPASGVCITAPRSRWETAVAALLGVVVLEVGLRLGLD